MDIFPRNILRRRKNLVQWKTFLILSSHIEAIFYFYFAANNHSFQKISILKVIVSIVNDILYVHMFLRLTQKSGHISLDLFLSNASHNFITYNELNDHVKKEV